jgi:hypothetical protein
MGIHGTASTIKLFLAAADIDKCVEELAKHNLKISAGTYVAWKRSKRAIRMKVIGASAARQESAVRSCLPNDGCDTSGSRFQIPPERRMPEWSGPKTFASKKGK